MTVVKKEVLSSDKIHTLAGVVVLPEGEAKGYVQIVHGMCEYTGRYKPFMEFLAENGYIAFGYDHLGHGRTGEKTGEFGYIADRDGWLRLIEDVGVFRDAVVKEYGEKPYYLFGHSMGSFIVRGAALRGVGCRKLIVSGTGGPNPASGAGIALCKVIGFFRGKHHVSKLVGGMAFGGYNARFKEENDSASWLTKDRACRDKYRGDPFCSFLFQVAAMEDLVKLQKYCNRKKDFRAFPKDLPTFLISGADDPVGDYGAGVKKVEKGMKEAGCDVRAKLYENCRHEILNDTCSDEVMKDLLAFIEE